MKRIVWLPIVLAFAILACSITTTAAPIVITATPAPSTSTPLVVVITATNPPATETPLPTYTPQPTYTPLPTYTPQVQQSTPGSNQGGAPTVTVSVDTQCRIGPGKGYVQLSGLVVGKSAKVVGKSADNQYWIIKNPTDIGNCWLWGEYATVTGDTSNLKVFEEPLWLKNYAFQLVVATWPDLANPGMCFYSAHLIGFPNDFNVTHQVRQRVKGEWVVLYSPKEFNTGFTGDYFILSNGSEKIKGDLLVTVLSANVNGAQTLITTSTDETNCK